MKKTIITIFLTIAIPISIIMILSLAYNVFIIQRPGVVRNVQIEIGESERFTQGEIEAAMEVVKATFAEQNDRASELIALWYNETLSTSTIEREGWDKENTIILYSEFYQGQGFGNDAVLMPMTWVLFRDNSDSWVLVTWGKADVSLSITDTSPPIYVVPHIANYPYRSEAFEIVDDAIKYELLEIISASLQKPAAQAEITELLIRSFYIQPSEFKIGDTLYSFERVQHLLVVEIERHRDYYILSDADFERVHEMFFELTK